MREFVGLVGRALITAGLLVLFFVGYQLWGTNIYEARAQNKLENEFEAALKEAPPPDPEATTTTAPPLSGDAIARLEIPDIGVDRIVVSGVTRAALQKGPGHYPSTPLPGQLGNAAIAGHRTTYGAPFFDVDKLKVGSKIKITTLEGTFNYVVTVDPFTVTPNDLSVLDPTENATLTLTTCNPKFSAAQRLIIKAQLDTEASNQPRQAAAHTGDIHPELTKEGLSGETAPREPVVLWGFLFLVVGGIWWLMFHRYPRWTTWVIGVIPFFAVMFVFYAYLERLLPANY